VLICEIVVEYHLLEKMERSTPTVMNCSMETDSGDPNAGFIERKIQEQVRENRQKSKPG